MGIKSDFLWGLGFPLMSRSVEELQEGIFFSQGNTGREASRNPRRP